MHLDDPHSGMLTAVVADEWCLVREGVRSLAGSLGIVSRVLASTATEALAELRPGELIVLGSCPDTSAEIAIRRARTVERARIVVLAAKIDRTTVLQLCTAGADAVFDRSARTMDLDIALDTVSKGHRYLAPTVLDVVFASAPNGVPPARQARLSAREVAVLELLATGRSNRADRGGAPHRCGDREDPSVEPVPEARRHESRSGRRGPRCAPACCKPAATWSIPRSRR